MAINGPCSRLCSWAHRTVVQPLVPRGSGAEAKELCKLAGPVILAQFMTIAVSLVSTIFCGHLGRVELAAVSLATSVINVTGISVGMGISSACDTLISQTFGSRNLLRIGDIMQRAILISILTCFPCWAVLANTELILLAVKQEPEVARLAQLYVNIFIPALPAAFMFILETKYLQNQGIIWPQVATGLAVNVLNVLINYIALYQFDLGVAGSAVANTMSEFLMAAILYAYIMWQGLHKATWAGWSKACLHNWDSYIHLAIPGMIMMCVEWWTYEIGNFLAGLISEVELGAQAVVYYIANMAYLFPLGFSVAGNVRVGNALGAGDTEQAKLAARMTVLCAGSVSVFVAILTGTMRDHISFIFTDDKQIGERVADVTTLYAPFITLDAVAAAIGGVIRGAGKQSVGAICNLIGFYGIGYPIGVPLMFSAKLGIMGLWTGLFICVFLQTTFLIIYLIRMNWTQVTQEAQVRAGLTGSSSNTCVESDEEMDSGDHSDTEELVDTVTELSHRAVVVRRGLALAAMLFILALGLILNTLITNMIT